MAEIVSELMYAGKTLKEIARLTNYQMQQIIFRPRDKGGALRRKDPELPEWVETDSRGMRVVSNPKPYGEMFRQVYENRGLDKDKIQETWNSFKEKNPQFEKKGVSRG